MDLDSLNRYTKLLSCGLDEVNDNEHSGRNEELRTMPLFTFNVARSVMLPNASGPKQTSSGQCSYATASSDDAASSNDSNRSYRSASFEGAAPSRMHVPYMKRSSSSSIQPEVEFTQFGLMGRMIKGVDDVNSVPRAKPIDPVFLNTNAPWSAFICGSQGSGKSHSLSVMLENCLLPNKSIGALPKPLSGLVFHYNTHSSNLLCEAAYIVEAGVKVKVLVSSSNYHNMKQLYKNIPGSSGRIKVNRLLLQPKHINTERMLKLMALSNHEGRPPLYMEIILRLLREMALDTHSVEADFDYNEFTARLKAQGFSKDQNAPLNMRLLLLESFLQMESGSNPIYMKGKVKPQASARNYSNNIFAFAPGELTIVDLTDPFVDSSTACLLFEICLALCLEDDTHGHGRVIALDEAHKYMTDSAASTVLTNTLLTTIREQRHTATRVIISTQEPTIAPALLDLCNITLVHRFSSPAWLRVLRQHLAGASEFVIAEQVEDENGANVSTAPGSTAERINTIFNEIVRLGVGQALLFAPAAMLHLCERSGLRKLGDGYAVIKMRPRIGGHGGRSVLAVR